MFAGVVGLLVLGLSALLITGEDTVMGRVLDHVLPDITARTIRCTSPLVAKIDLTKDPPEYLCAEYSCSKEIEARGVKPWEIAEVRVHGFKSFGDGFWAPVHDRTDIRVEIDFGAFYSWEIGRSVPDPALAEKLRRIALEGLRREYPDDAWLRPAALDTAPFDQWFRAEEVRITRPIRGGYTWNAMAAFALAAVL